MHRLSPSVGQTLPDQSATKTLCHTSGSPASTEFVTHWNSGEVGQLPTNMKCAFLCRMAYSFDTAHYDNHEHAGTPLQYTDCVHSVIAIISLLTKCSQLPHIW